MKVFSFCLYGTQPHYYTGLLENIQLIQKHYPDFTIFVYVGECDPSWVLPESVTVIHTGKAGAINMLFRYKPMGFAEVGFVRDADSRITERDRWCIDAFVRSTFSYHVIRDHVWHKSKIMGGLFGWKESRDLQFDEDHPSGYGYDETILSESLYPVIRDKTLVHTNLVGYVREHTERIPMPPADPHDFVGNVYKSNGPVFQSFMDPVEQVFFLQTQDQFGIIQFISDSIDPFSIPFDKRTQFYDTCFIANYYLRDVPKCQYWLSKYEFADITPHIVNNANHLFTLLNKRIVATFDPTREPSDAEMVIVYGAYPDWQLALPIQNKIYRHVSMFETTHHDVVEYDTAWDPVGTIYIVNLEERVDRYYETLLALAAVRAPIHRVYHYKAQKDALPSYMGATKNHVDVIDHFCKSPHQHCLVLEDDFLFIHDPVCVRTSLQEFFAKPREYTLCFLSLSKFGRREPHDELLGKSLQPCTTSSGYFLQKSTAHLVNSVVSEGFQKMVETNDHHTYCIDRFWTKLPTILYFRKKLGFQRPSYSNLLRAVSAYLD
jgi:hypothetical protein